MSYDVILRDFDPDRPLEEQLEEDDADAPGGAPDPAAVARNRRIADALRSARPQYELWRPDGGEPDADESHVELTDPEGIEVALYVDEAAIAVPYWDSLDVDEVVAQIGEAVATIAAETGWRAYDPQLDKLLDLPADAAALRAGFADGVAITQRLAQPLWRRLLRRR